MYMPTERVLPMSRAKIIAIAAVTVLVIIIVLQNTQAVETKLLFVTVSMPRAVLLFVTLLAGFALGLVAAGWLGKLSGKKPPSSDAPPTD